MLSCLNCIRGNDPSKQPLLQERDSSDRYGHEERYVDFQETSVEEAKASNPVFFDVLSRCNKVAGEENINEFLPYTIMSLTNKAFYTILFLIYFSHVKDHGGDSANGVTYESRGVNITNATSVVVTGLALFLLTILSGINAWRYRKVVLKEKIPTEMRGKILTINNIRALRILHTVGAAGINIVNGCFQIIYHASKDKRVTNIGVSLARDTALPALAFILSKNLFDFCLLSRDFINCQQNISSLRKKNMAEWKSASTDTFRESLISHLNQKWKDLAYNTVSSGLVTAGMTALVFGITKQIPVRVAVTFFLTTATPGQLIPVFRKIWGCCYPEQKPETSDIEDKQTLYQTDKVSLMKALSTDLSANGSTGYLINNLHIGFFGHLNMFDEKENGLEGLSQILF